MKTNSHRRQALSGTLALVQGSCWEPGQVRAWGPAGLRDRGQQPGARRGSKGLPWGGPGIPLLRSAPPWSRGASDSVYPGISRTTCILKAFGRSWALSQHRRCTRCLTAGHFPRHLAALQATGPNWEERRTEVGRPVGQAGSGSISLLAFPTTFGKSLTSRASRAPSIKREARRWLDERPWGARVYIERPLCPTRERN